MNDNPLVSICIPVFNGEKTIDETLQSILNQTYQNIEIIISDNASTDKTLERVRCCNDSRISLYTNKNNTVCGERNWDKCIELANGEYVAIFHADDLYSPDIIEKEVRMFQKYPELGAVFTKINRVNENGKYIGESSIIDEFKDKCILKKEEVFPCLLKYGNSFLNCPSAMVKSVIYKKLYPFRYDKFRSASDLDMWLRILKNHKIGIINETLMSYRISETQGSTIINHLRTERADGLRVLDYYLHNDFKDLEIDKRARNRFNLRSYADTIYIIKNNLISGNMNRAKEILVEQFKSIKCRDD